MCVFLQLNGYSLEEVISMALPNSKIPLWNKKWKGTVTEKDPMGTFPISSALAPLWIHWKDWCWSWSWNTFAIWCKEQTHWKRPWCWERLKAGGEGDDRGWDGWMALPTRWTWVWASSGSWWWTGKPGVLQPMGLQRVWRNWETELKYTDNSIWCTFPELFCRCKNLPFSSKWKTLTTWWPCAYSHRPPGA